MSRHRTSTRFPASLSALALLLSACAGTPPPQPGPALPVYSKPAPLTSMRAPAIPPPVTVPKPSTPSAQPPPAPPPLTPLTPEQAAGARSSIAKTLGYFAQIYRAQPDKVYGAMKLPSDSRSMRHLMDAMMTAFLDPSVQKAFAAKLDDAELQQISRNPEAIGGAFEQLFSGPQILTLPDERKVSLLAFFGGLYDSVSPQDCEQAFGGRDSASLNVFYTLLDHQPDKDVAIFIDDMRFLVSMPPAPPPEPLTQMQNELVALAARSYFQSLPPDQLQRLQTAMSTAHSPDRCWAIGQFAHALLAADPEVQALGARMVFQNAGKKQ